MRGRVRIQHGVLDALDFTAADLGQVVFLACTLTDCLLDGADLRGSSLAGSHVADCSFTGARWRDASLGWWFDEQPTTYDRVAFVRADLRGGFSKEVVYRDCDFSSANLTKVEFHGSHFIRCRFAGVLRETMFYGTGFRDSPMTAPNPMEDVDFSDARLRYVGFRRVDLSRARLPDNDEHVIIRHPSCVRAFARALRESGAVDVPQNVLGMALSSMEGSISVVSALDLADDGSPADVQQVLAFLRTLEAPVPPARLRPRVSCAQSLGHRARDPQAEAVDSTGQAAHAKERHPGPAHQSERAGGVSSFSGSTPDRIGARQCVY